MRICLNIDFLRLSEFSCLPVDEFHTVQFLIHQFDQYGCAATEESVNNSSIEKAELSRNNSEERDVTR